MSSRSRSSSSEGKNQSFLKAARAGNLSKVNDYIQQNLDINSISSNGLNALHLAAKEGHQKIVQTLLEHGAKCDMTTKKGNTALHISSLAGHFEIVKSLVENKANVNAQSQSGFTPLYMAAQENHVEIVEYLLDKGANQALLTEDGFSPLAVALQQGHEKIVTILLERDNRSKVRLPALHIAAKKDDINAVKLFLSNTSVNVDHASASGFTPLHIATHYGNKNMIKMLIERGANVNYKAKSNITPLHLAAKWGKPTALTTLLSAGAEVDSRTRDGLTPLHCAARSGHSDILDLLIRAGADASAKTKSGLSPLHMAAQGDHVQIAQSLIRKGVAVDNVTMDYLTPLHIAAHCGSSHVAQILLENNSDVNLKALNGFSALHIACKKKEVKMIELLLQNQADINSTNDTGLTPLHIASLIGSQEAVEILLRNGSQIDSVSMRNETPLHYAVRGQKKEIVDLLLKNGCNTNIFDNDDMSPLDIAIKLNDVGIAEALVNYPGTNINYSSSKEKTTPLHLVAKEMDETGIVDKMVQRNASLIETTKRGYTPLHLAAKSGNVNVFKQFVDTYNQDVNQRSSSGYTPLHLAVNFNRQEVIDVLLKRDATEVNALSKSGLAPLHLAIRNQNLAVVKSLVDRGARIDLRTSNGFTPLHIASIRGNEELSKYIIDKDPEQIKSGDENGLTPVHIAAQEDNVESLKHLLEGTTDDQEILASNNYSPLHLAAYYGQLNSTKLLIADAIKKDIIEDLLNARTSLGNSPLHIAAQQGHALVIQRILEAGSKPNFVNNEGWTAAQIANKKNYQKAFETLSKLTTNVADWSKPDASSENPSSKCTFDNPIKYSVPVMSDSDGESSDTASTPVILRKKLDHKGKESSKFESLCKSIEYMRPKDENTESIMVTSSQNYDPRVTSQETVASKFNSQDSTRSSLVRKSFVEPSFKLPTLDQPVASNQITEWNFESDINPVKKKPFKAGFLVSFLVDARGCQVETQRKVNLKFYIPPNATNTPSRVVCRLIRPDLSMTRPMLNDGDALASRLLELSPYQMKFDTPIMLEVPHVASLRGREREVVVLRSDNGDTWKEHSIDTSEQTIKDIIGQHFGNISNTQEQSKKNIQRIVTNDFPQYFALVSRFRQEIALVGPEGGVICSTVMPQVQAIFPQGSLQKRIKIGLQTQAVPVDLVNKLFGNRIAVSPIVSIEPRRRKFHKPITIKIPLPKFPKNAYTSNYKENIRLLCSITGGTNPAFWEDITGSTHLSRNKDCATFTTTVSARLWLIDANSDTNVTEMANVLYKESIIPPYLGKFVLFSKEQAECCPVQESNYAKDIRCLCLIDDTAEKTLESRENYKLISEGPTVEVLDDKNVFLTSSGNLEFVKKRGEQQAKMSIKAFRENRVTYNVTKKDNSSSFSGDIIIMPESNESIQLAKVTGVTFEPITKLKANLSPSHEAERAVSSDIAKMELDTTELAKDLRHDWKALGTALGLSNDDLNMIEQSNKSDSSNGDFCMQTIKLWEQKSSLPKEALGNKLADSLKTIGREDLIRHCMKSVQPVVETSEINNAKRIISGDSSIYDSLRSESAVQSRTTSPRRVKVRAPVDGKEFGLDGKLTAETGSIISNWVNANLNQTDTLKSENTTLKPSTMSFVSYDSEYTMSMSNDFAMDHDGNRTPTNEIDDSEITMRFEEVVKPEASLEVEGAQKEIIDVADTKDSYPEPEIDLIKPKSESKSRSRFDIFKFKKSSKGDDSKKKAKKGKKDHPDDSDQAVETEIKPVDISAKAKPKKMNIFKRLSRSRSTSVDVEVSPRKVSKGRQVITKELSKVLKSDDKLNVKPVVNEDQIETSEAEITPKLKIKSEIMKDAELAKRPTKKLQGTIIPMEILPPLDVMDHIRAKDQFLEEFLDSTSRKSDRDSMKSHTSKEQTAKDAFEKTSLTESQMDFEQIYDDAVKYQHHSSQVDYTRGNDVVESLPEVKRKYEEVEFENDDGTNTKMLICEEEEAQAISFREWQEGLEAAIEAGFILKQEPEEIIDVKEIDELLPDGTVVTRIITTKRIIERLTERFVDEDLFMNDQFSRHENENKHRMVRVTD